MLQEYIDKLLPGILNVGIKVILAFVVFFVGAKVIKLIRKILQRFLERVDADLGLRQFLDSLVKIVLYFLLIVLISTSFGISTTSIAALISSVGIAVGLALQGSLANFAGGVLILLLKPFKVGDYIVEDSNKNEGTVSEIQLFYTKLVTPDNRVVIIPNGTLANNSLTNVTTQDKRRLDIVVGVSYEADLKQVKKVLEAVLLKEERRLLDHDVNVFISELAASSVNMGCRLWVKKEDYWPVKWDLTEEIKYQLEENGFTIPFNQLDVSIKNIEK